MSQGRYVSEFIRSWWVVAFMLLCLFIFEQSVKSREAQRKLLEQQWQDLKATKERELQKLRDLENQINSQSDPAWIELLLMKGLGLVPEDEVKIYFPNSNP